VPRQFPVSTVPASALLSFRRFAVSQTIADTHSMSQGMPTSEVSDSKAKRRLWGDCLPLPPEPRAPSIRRIKGKQALQACDFHSPDPAEMSPPTVTECTSLSFDSSSSRQTPLNNGVHAGASPELAATADYSKAREDPALLTHLYPQVAFPAPRNSNGPRPRSRSASAGLRMRLFHSPFASEDEPASAQQESVQGVTPEPAQLAWDSGHSNARVTEPELRCPIGETGSLSHLESTNGDSFPEKASFALPLPDDAAVQHPRLVSLPEGANGVANGVATCAQPTSAGGRLPPMLQDISCLLLSCGISRVDMSSSGPRMECASVTDGTCAGNVPPDSLFRVCGDFPSEVYCAACLNILREKFESLCVKPISIGRTGPSHDGDERVLDQLLDSIEMLGDMRPRGRPQGHCCGGARPASDTDLPAQKRQRHPFHRQNGQDYSVVKDLNLPKQLAKLAERLSAAACGA